MLSEPSLSDLRLFTVVVKHASFVKAAHALSLAQTTVSKRVAILEEALGVKLFQRTTRTVNVTDEGIKVYQWAQKILDAVSYMQEELAVGQIELQGPIRVGRVLDFVETV